MAQQKGIIPLRGTIGNINFYKSKDGYMAREKTSLDGNRIANDPGFQRTRENGAEFGRAGKAGKILRTAIRALLQNSSDSKMVSRLTRDMIKVIQADLTNPRGLRNVIDGEAELLLGFDFNLEGKLSTTVYAPYTATIDRATGQLEITIPAFIPANMINAPGGSTHFKINAAAAAIDFEQNEYEAETSATAELPLNGTLTAPITLTHTLTANSTRPLFLVMGVEFYQQVNGLFYPLKSGAFNALAIVSVSGL